MSFETSRPLGFRFCEPLCERQLGTRLRRAWGRSRRAFRSQTPRSITDDAHARMFRSQLGEGAAIAGELSDHSVDVPEAVAKHDVGIPCVLQLVDIAAWLAKKAGGVEQALSWRPITFLGDFTPLAPVIDPLVNDEPRPERAPAQCPGVEGCSAPDGARRSTASTSVIRGPC